MPTTVVDATGEPASFALVGSQRGWSNAEPGKIIETIVASRCANPIIVVDEVEKAGEVMSTNGSRFSLTDALLPLLERMTASTWQCPYYRIKCDMSWVGWVLTANSLEGVSEALLSRCPPLDLPPISKAHLVAFARRQCQSRELPDEAVDAIEEIIWMSRGDIGGPSLRTVKRMIDRAEITAGRPVLH